MPAGSCDRMLGVHAHAPHDTSCTSARGSCGRHRRSPLRPRSTHTPAMPSDATGGWPCLHPPCVSSRAHHPAHYLAHGHMQRRAYMRALADVCIRNIAYPQTAHTATLSHALGLRRHPVILTFIRCLSMNTPPAPTPPLPSVIHYPPSSESLLIITNTNELLLPWLATVPVDAQR